jgi:uncharacterized repeat protein (TIGR01451 family)
VLAVRIRQLNSILVIQKIPVPIQTFLIIPSSISPSNLYPKTIIMNRRLLVGSICAIFLLLMNSGKADAQITGVNISDFTDSIQNHCLTPSEGAIFIYGQVTGTPASNDSVDMYINFGDGTDTSLKLPIWQNYFYYQIPHIWQVAGIFTMTATATVNGYTDTYAAIPVTVSNTCAPLSGVLYLDYNSNCLQDAGEAGIFWTQLAITNTTTSSTYYTYTDINGAYSVNLPIGYTYSVAPAASVTLTPSCPSSGTASVTLSGSAVTSDFAYSCNTAAIDAAITGVAVSWRPGFDRIIHLWASSNSYCDSISGVVTLTLDPLLSLTSSVSPVASVSGSTITWNVADLSAWNDWWTNCQIFCDPSATFGDTLCVTVNVATTPADGNPSNNTYTFCAPVINSCDPNEKAVAPQGIGEDGKIPNGTRLTYTVRFQNTGNDVAYNVNIKDELDADLDYSTLKVMSTSHDMLQPYINGNEVTFAFSNINLPDSTANEPASHGYVTYSVSPKPNLPIGTEITNLANIYFDTNLPIATNSTKNTIFAPQSVQQVSGSGLTASVYPNPANSSVSVRIDKTEFTAVLFDMAGKTMAVAGGKGNATINTSAIPSGVYMLKMVTNDNKVLTTRLSIMH